MSMDYWAIKGFGLEINKEYFDWWKLLGFVKSQYDFTIEDIFAIENKEDFEKFLDNKNIDFDEIIYLIIEDYGNNNIGYVKGVKAGTGDYILFISGCPWEFSKEDMNITKKDAAEMIYECISPFLKDSLLKQDILQQMDYVSTYGCA